MSGLGGVCSQGVWSGGVSGLEGCLVPGGVWSRGVCVGLGGLLYFGSIRIYILMTGVVSNETNTYVRMYIEEFILVDIWIHWS